MSEYITEIQNHLKGRGLYSGVVDGLMGPVTAKAIVTALKGASPEVQNYRVSKNFFLSELLRSDTAIRKNISNIPEPQHLINLVRAVQQLWQPIRDELGVPMLISSGYRGELLNNIIGGSDSSAHSIGSAIDFTAPAAGSSRVIAVKILRFLRTKKIPFDQVILEFPDSPSSWVHIGHKNRANEQRGQSLVALKVNGRTEYKSGII